MAEAMLPGSVIVDIAAERGGNCELTRAGETVVHRGVSVVGAVHLPSRAPFHASQMYATNVVNLLKLMIDKEGKLSINRDDEIIRGCLVTYEGKIVHPALAPAAVTQGVSN
jgi:NAD(P) transhydrogenase subunit alpha